MKTSVEIYFLFAFLHVLAFAQTNENEKRVLPADVSGRWSGKFDLTLQDGTVQQDTAWFDLKQKNTVLTGTAGASAEKQTAITDGQVKGNIVQFKMNVRAGIVLTFNLVFIDNRLKGEVTGESQSAKIQIDVIRIKSSESMFSLPPQNLRDEILQQDQIMFGAFNNRDLKKFKTFFSEDLEFYQDLTGLTDYRKNIETFRTNFAKTTKVRRELDVENLEVYPIKNYGAIEIGIHRFYVSETNSAEKLTAEVKFIHVWQKNAGIWKITRVISYGH